MAFGSRVLAEEIAEAREEAGAEITRDAHMIKPARMPSERHLNVLARQRVRRVLESECVHGIPIGPIHRSFEIPFWRGTERDSGGSHLRKRHVETRAAFGRVRAHL